MKVVRILLLIEMGISMCTNGSHLRDVVLIPLGKEEG